MRWPTTRTCACAWQAALNMGARRSLPTKRHGVRATHVSGLSAEILLMHLKKRLGRRRTRFVLLAPPDQTTTPFSNSITVMSMRRRTTICCWRRSNRWLNT